MKLKVSKDIINLVCNDIEYSDGGYYYSLKGNINGVENFENTGIRDIKVYGDDKIVEINGLFECGLKLCQTFHINSESIEEEITLINGSDKTINIDNIEIGFITNLEKRRDWNLCAVPFRVQLDGRVHDYSVNLLIDGKFQNFVNGSKEFDRDLYYGNSVYEDPTRKEPELMENGILRSEAWALGDVNKGILIVKYNNSEIEYSIACSYKDKTSSFLRFGGAGLCLYGEPSGVRTIKARQKYTFGKTSYFPYNNGKNEAFYIYRKFLEDKGHGFDENYNPPVNWNELYDVGWYHSDLKELEKHYTKETLFKEAEKAKQCSCDLLYLDPGWEYAEGTTLWDWNRLGKVKDFIDKLKKEYGLELGYRTILHCYTNYWPQKYLIKESNDVEATGYLFCSKQMSWPLCISGTEFWREKLRRILEISKQGVKFMMFDEMDWRGSCVDDKHGHETPTHAIDHVNAVYNLVAEVRKQCPGLIAEVHDPVWPWHTSIYVPTYFKQGFGEKGCYDENWGFEYMWNCLQDLTSGKALALYYYNLGCNIPLYLHITMAADNDNCLFLWWAASTIRHLGIGGKDSSPSVEAECILPPYDHEKRFDNYCKQMKIYKKLKDYFAKGNFYGINEHIHLHTLNGIKGGVVNVFNITDIEKEITFNIPYELIEAENKISVSCGKVCWGETSVSIGLKVPAMSPMLVCLGEADKL